MLKPYEQPLLVVLVATRNEDIVKSITGLAARIVSGVYPKSNENIKDVQLLVVYVDRVSIPTQAANLLPSYMLSEGETGYSFFWTSQDKLIIEDVQDGENDSSSHEDSGSFSIRLFEPVLQQSQNDSAYSQFRISLANTTFSTGRPYTMWTKTIKPPLLQDETKEPDTTIRKEGVLNYLENRNVRLDIDGIHGHFELQTYSKEARTALTPWRTVTEVSGNIIKRLKDDNSRPIPASMELESVISEVPASEHGQFEIWIEHASKQDNLDFEPQSKNKTRMIKVVGGGGGWGEKQGLIALDPKSVPDRNIWDTFDLKNMFPNSCEVGDEIRFIKVSARRPNFCDLFMNGVAISRICCMESHGFTNFGFGTTGDNGVELPKSIQKNASFWQPIIYGHFGSMSRSLFYEQHSVTDSKGMAADIQKSTHGTDLPPYTHYSTAANSVTSDEPPYTQGMNTQDKFNSKTADQIDSDINFVWTHTNGPGSSAEVRLLIKTFPQPYGIEEQFSSLQPDQPIIRAMPSHPNWKEHNDSKLPIRLSKSIKSRSPSHPNKSNKPLNSKHSTPQDPQTGRTLKRKLRRVRTNAPLIRPVFIEKSAPNLQDSEWASEENLILANLKSNAPKSAEAVYSAQWRRYEELFRDPTRSDEGKLPFKKILSKRVGKAMRKKNDEDEIGNEDESGDEDFGEDEEVEIREENER